MLPAANNDELINILTHRRKDAIAKYNKAKDLLKLSEKKGKKVPHPPVDAFASVLSSIGHKPVSYTEEVKSRNHKTLKDLKFICGQNKMDMECIIPSLEAVSIINPLVEGDLSRT